MSERLEREYEGEWYDDPMGFTILPRSFWDDDPDLDDPAFKPWHPSLFWQYIVSLAVWDRNGRTVQRDGEVIHLERGQLYYSLRYLGKRPGWSKDTVARRFEKWERETRPDGTPDPRIRREVRHKGTVITVLKYDPYQDFRFYQKGGVRHKARRRRDARETNNNIPPEEVPKNRGGVASDQDHPSPPTTWRDMRAARDFGILTQAPEHVQKNMLRSAIACGPPPDDLREWANDLADTLGEPFPYPPPPTSEELQRIRDRLHLLISEDDQEDP